ncbi:4be93348-e508-4881-88cd-6a9821626906 [Sclerotinia trifoliorum]|uniref:4be93348-e508-4881-88cd-6a9821626906 n=1 Tax=Sclerotinia trifoliorum TaxID=28548 RepID=A0A8H2VU53_9HELO|nr:4be93348-e508-4881-88cd-6a9821626906 [Sclerotinia trifoliorum]
MSPPFLQTLPREIRDSIYTYILGSPDGVITFLPWSIEVARSLSILRTCKQIHRECKDVIWKHKGLRLRESTQLEYKLENIYSMLGETARWHILIQLEVLDWDELEWVGRSLASIAGSLQNLHGITIKANKERPQTVEEFEDILDLRENGEIVDGRLYQEYPGIPSADKEPRTWMINTSWPRLSPWAKRKWLAEMLIDTADTRKLLYGIHNKFGGRLYVDGVLCLKEGSQTVEDFNLDARDGEIKIIPGRRIENC